MNTYRDVIELWETRVSMAADLGMHPVSVSAWWQRNSIPAPWFRRVVSAAKRAGHKGVTLELLSRLAEARASEKPGEAA